MHPVGHEADRVVLGTNLRPLIRAQPRRDRAMDAAHAVDVARAAQREARHVEKARGGRGTRQLEDALDRHPQLAHEIPEVRDDQLQAEGVVAGRHRSVGGEHAVRRHRFEGGVEGQALRQVLAQQLENQKRRVPFVQVPHGGGHPERAQRAQAADAEDHFLAHPRGLIPAVQAMGDVTIRGDVLGAIGVEQIDRNAAHLRLPQPRDDLAPGDAHRDLEPLARRIAHRLDRQIARVALAIFGLLHPVVVDGLSEIPLLVQKPHRHEVGALVARRLAVVPGEHPEASGVDGEALVKAVLGAEVRHQRRLGGGCAEPQVRFEGLEREVIARQVQLIASAALQRLLVDATKHQAGIAVGLLPQLRIQILEQRPGGTVPAEEQVGGQLREARQAPRDDGGDFQERVSHHRSRKRREV